MPRRKISFDVQVNTPSAQREADRLKNIFESRLRNIGVGTQARGTGGAGGGGATRGGGGSSRAWGPFGQKSPQEWLGATAMFAVSGFFYQFFSSIPSGIVELDRLATTNMRATKSFESLAGGAQEANAMIDGYIQGAGGAVDRITATTEAMRLFNIGMADNADQMRAFTTLSRGMSQALGRPVDYITEQFSLALANQSMLRFDQLGLSIERHQELVEQLSAQYPEFSKELVFQNAMLTQAAERYYNLALAQESLATSTEVLGRELKDANAIFAEMMAQRVTQPLSAWLARGLGAEDFNLDVPFVRHFQRSREQGVERMQGGPNVIDFMMGGLFMGQSNDQIRQQHDQVMESMAGEARMAEALVNAMNALQAAQNMGIEINDSWVDTVRQGNATLGVAGTDTEYWTGRLNALVEVIEMAVDPTDAVADSLLRAGDAAAAAKQELDDFAGAVVGAAAGMVGKLIAAGMPANQAIEMVGGSEAAIRRRAEEFQAAGALRGDAISDAAALALAEQEFTAAGEAWLDAAQEAEAAHRRAASEAEQAAKRAEKAFLNAADGLVDAYDEMLGKIPGLFGTSEVTEEDLKLAELGEAVNFTDDYLRRVMDVAFNDKSRADVDMGLVRQALGLGEKTPDEVTAIRFQRAWESGSLWANPENIERFLNLDAARANLRDQEMAALGTQNLRAFFGLGTEEGNEFLRVFGLQALDPIEDGLITEITTRGPIMGETLAGAIHDGFSKAALSFPWVRSIMSAVESQVGRELLSDLNTNTTGDLAEAEAIP